MCSANIFRAILLVAVLLMLAACGDNLFPSGEDKRPAVISGSTGPAPGQKAADFTVSDSSGVSVSLTAALASRKGIVLYFTMWCPICDSHMSNMRERIPAFPDVGFYAVDYVSGSVADAGISAAANGFAGSFHILADTNRLLLSNLQATMGTTVVIDSSGSVRMNEDYRDGSRLAAVLAALP